MSTAEAAFEGVMQAEDLGPPGAGEAPGLAILIKQAVREVVEEQNQSPWFDAREAAEYLGYSTSQIQTLSGPNTHGPDRLPCHRLTRDGEKRFHKRELDEHLLRRGE